MGFKFRIVKVTMFLALGFGSFLIAQTVTAPDLKEITSGKGWTIFNRTVDRPRDRTAASWPNSTPSRATAWPGWTASPSRPGRSSATSWAGASPSRGASSASPSASRAPRPMRPSTSGPSISARKTRLAEIPFRPIHRPPGVDLGPPPAGEARPVRERHRARARRRPLAPCPHRRRRIEGRGLCRRRGGAVPERRPSRRVPNGRRGLVGRQQLAGQVRQPEDQVLAGFLRLALAIWRGL